MRLAARHSLFFTGILALVALAAACKKAPPVPQISPADCERLNAHIVDVTIDESVSQERDLSDAAKKKLGDELRTQMKDDPAGKKMAAGCEKEFTRQELDCMMQASTTKAMDTCEGIK